MAILPANDSLETATIVEVINGMRLKMNSYPAHLRDYCEKTLQSFQDELDRREVEEWIEPSVRPIVIKGASKEVAATWEKNENLDFVKKISFVSFYSTGHYTVNSVTNTDGNLTATRYYRTADDAHEAGMKWMEVNGITPNPNSRKDN